MYSIEISGQDLGICIGRGVRTPCKFSHTVACRKKLQSVRISLPLLYACIEWCASQQGISTQCPRHPLTFCTPPPLGTKWYQHYRTPAKVRPWALHLTFSPNRGVGALSSVSAFNLERAPTFVYVHKKRNSSDRAASTRESKPSQHIYIAGVTSNITAHHVVFAAAKRWLTESSVEAVGPSSAQASQATHMDTIDTDTQTNRDLLQGGSYLRYARTSH